MTNSRKTARIHLLPAKESPYCVLLRRKPSKWVHVIRWNTETGEIEHGSWFQGRIFEFSCDVSPDGRWLFYAARGQGVPTYWCGVSEAPWLKTLRSWETDGNWLGDGYWPGATELKVDHGTSVFEDLSLLVQRLFLGEPEPESRGDLPFKVGRLARQRTCDKTWAGFEGRLHRDGWRFVGECVWSCKPSRDHPELRLTMGYHRARFELEGSALVDSADWACYHHGVLLAAVDGRIQRFKLEDLNRRDVRWELDLESIEVPTERLNYRPPVEGLRE
jgi:hypothetical protein